MYKTAKEFIRELYPRFFAHCEKRKLVIKFVVSGSLATAVDFSFLYFFTEYFKIWYLTSSVLAFALAFIVSFSMQKFWTFRDNDLDRIHKQLSSYFVVALINLFLNSNGMFILVDKFEIHYLLAQVIVAALLGIISFIIYRFMIFKKKKSEQLGVLDNIGIAEKEQTNLALISLDKKIFNEDSATLERLKEYSGLVEKIFVIVWTIKEEKPIIYQDKLFIYPTNSGIKIKYLFDTLKIFKSIYKKNRVDMIFTQDPFETGFAGWIIKQIYKLPLQLQIHGDFGNGYFKKESCMNVIRFQLANFLLPKADHIRVVSKRITDYLVNELKIKAEKITEIPIFSNVECEILMEDENKRNDFVFLTVGRLEKVKNIEMQIRALASIAKENPQMKLMIAGDGSEKDNLQRLCVSLRINNQVEFLGWVDGLEDIYGRTDCFMLTSNYEGWGLAVVEAAGFGLPIIMTDVGCAGELIKDGESGIVIPVGSQSALESAMVSMMENKEQRKKMAEGAAKNLKKLPNKEDTLKLYLESWERTILKD